MLPKNPAILRSFANRKLRDCYSSLEELCADLDADPAELSRLLETLKYRYDSEHNQFALCI